LDADTHWHTRGMPVQTTAPRHGVTLGDTLLDAVKPSDGDGDGDTLAEKLADALCVGSEAATDGDTDALASTDGDTDALTLLDGVMEEDASQMHV
jgi:hypothetical protein